MKRIRTVFLAALAVLALAGVAGVSTASAARFVSETEYTAFKSSSASQQISFSPSGTVYECNGPSFSGTAFGGSVAGGGYASKSFTSSSVSSPACVGGTMTWNSCQLTLHPPSGAVGGTGTVDIGPSGCTPTKFQYFGCEFTIPAQSGLSATYENTGSGSGRKVWVVINTNSLEYTSLTNAGCGSIGTRKDGRWIAKFYLAGTNLAGTSPSGLRVAQLPVGFRVGGEKSENPSEQPHFVHEWEMNPETLAGDISKEHRFAVNPGIAAMTCKSGSFATVLTAPSTSLSLTTNYEPCDKFLGSVTTVKMNSCHYGLDLANSGPPYVGTAEVVCGTEGDAIEFQVGTICTYELGPQVLGSATYSNTGSLNEEKVVAEVSGTSLTYVRTYNGFFCPKPAAGEGTFSGGILIKGVEA